MVNILMIPLRLDIDRLTLSCSAVFWRLMLLAVPDEAAIANFLSIAMVDSYVSSRSGQEYPEPE